MRINLMALRALGALVCQVLTGLAAAATFLRPSGPGRAFQLDDVSLGIGQINGWAFAFRAITGLDFARFDSFTAKVLEKLLSVEWFYPQAEVIQVPSLRAWSGSAQFPQGPIDGNEIDERISGAELIKAQVVLNLFHRTPDDVRVEIEHRLQIPDTNYKMIDVLYFEHHFFRGFENSSALFAMGEYRRFKMSAK